MSWVESKLSETELNRIKNWVTPMSAQRCTQPCYLQRSLKFSGSNIEQEIVAHPEELRRNRRRLNTLTDVDTLLRYRFDLQISPLDWFAELAVGGIFCPHSIFHSKLWLIHKSHDESVDIKMLVLTLIFFSNINLTSRNHYMISFGRISGQTSPYSILQTRLWLTQKNHAESDDAKILSRTGPYFSNIGFTSRTHYVT